MSLSTRCGEKIGENDIFCPRCIRLTEISRSPSPVEIYPSRVTVTVSVSYQQIGFFEDIKDKFDITFCKGPSAFGVYVPIDNVIDVISELLRGDLAEYPFEEEEFRTIQCSENIAAKLHYAILQDPYLKGFGSPIKRYIEKDLYCPMIHFMRSAGVTAQRLDPRIVYIDEQGQLTGSDDGEAVLEMYLYVDEIGRLTKEIDEYIEKSSLMGVCDDVTASLHDIRDRLHRDPSEWDC